MSNRIGIVFGCFDLLHTGHILLLQEAARNCDTLVVGLQTDPTLERPEKNKPVQTYFERLTQLDAVEWVDYIVGYSHERDIIPIMESSNVSIRFLGEDYLDKDFTGKEYCEENGIDIHYVSRSHGYSTTELRNRIKESK